MNIIRNSDIAQLVLGYLRDQNLEHAADSFCKTSPYLKEERRLMKKGLKAMSLGSGTLVDIIKEHCQIKSKISQLIDILPTEDRERILKQNTLVERLSCLVKMIGKEKVTERRETFTRNHRKRARSHDSLDNLKTTKVQDLPGFNLTSNFTKRRRKSTSYFFLSNSTMVDDSVTDEDEKESSVDSSEKSGNSSSSLDTDMNEGEEIDTVTVNQLEQNICPDDSITVPVLSDTILKKTEFQNVLVENINKALQTSVQFNSSNNLEKSPEKTSQKNEIDNCDQSILTAQLDEMIKKILDETAKDPTFDEIIKETISLTNSNKKSQSGKSDLQTPPRKSDKSSSQSQPNKNSTSQTDKKSTCTSNKSTQVSPCKEINISQNCPESSPVLKSTIASQSDKQTILMSSENENPIIAIDPNIPQKFILLNANEPLGTLGGDTALLSCANLNNIQGFNSNDQVFLDLNSGQLSIPLITTNDNVSFPVLVNNEIIKQLPQQHENFERNNLDKNIVNEQNTTMNVELFKDVQQQSEIVLHQATVSKPETKLNENTSKSATNSLNVDLENTPQNSIQPPTVHSLSTPRRRMSHVRVLNFGTAEQIKEQNHEVLSKISDRNDNIDQKLELANSVSQPIDNCVASEAVSNVEITQNNDKVNEKIVVTSVTVLKSRENQPNETKMREDSKPQKKKTLKTKKNKMSPPRKGNKKLRKILPKPPSKLETKDNNKEEEVITLEKWNQMRATFSLPNWDQHLRELQAKSSLNLVKSKKSTKKVSKKKGKSKEKTDSPEIESTENKSEVKDLNVDQKLNEENKDENSKNEISKNLQSNRQLMITKSPSSSDQPTQESSVSPKIVHSSPNSAYKKGLIKFKIPTPTKKVKEIQQTEEKIENIVGKENNVEMPESNTKSMDKVFEIPPPIESNNHVEERNHVEGISILLETPYKTDTFQIPITPRFIMIDAQETPITKMMKAIQAQASNQKQILDIETPNFAITPGAGLINNIEKETPISAGGTYNNRLTDYSSGGSYYKPDESEDLDRHLDRLLMAERKKKQSPIRKAVTETLHIKKSEMNNISNEENNINYDDRKQKQTNINACERNKSLTSSKKRNNNKKVAVSTNTATNIESELKSNLSLSEVSSTEDEDDWTHESPNNKVTLKTTEKILSTVKKHEKNISNSSTKRCTKNDETDKDKRAKQLFELEAKRLRIKAKLKTDFNTKTKETTTRMMTRKLSAIKERSIIGTSKKIIKKSSTSIRTNEPSKKLPTAVKEPAATITSDSPVPVVSDSATDEMSKNETDVLKALNLSAKKQPESAKLPVPLTKENKKEFDNAVATKKVIGTHTENDNATTGDNFESEIIRLRVVVEDDSHDSAESAKVRNAALVLTGFQKKLNSQNDHSKNEFIQNQTENNIGQEQNKIFVVPSRTTTNTSKNSETEERTVVRSPRLRDLKRKVSFSESVQRKYQTREVKFSSKRKPLLSTSSKQITENSRNQTRTIQTRSFKNLESTLEKESKEKKVPQKIKARSLTSSNTKLKKEVRKQSEATEKIKTQLNYKSISPIPIKQPKVVLEIMTADKLPVSPVKFKAHENQQNNISNKENEEEKNSSLNENIKNDSSEKILEKPIIECDTVRSDDVNKLEKSSLNEMDNTAQISIDETIEYPQNNQEENLKQSENEKLNENHTKNDDNSVEHNEEDNEEEDEEDDPYDECKMVTIDESDSKRFIKIIHRENDDKPLPSTVTKDFDKNILKTKMKIFLNNVLHSIEVTDEIELFVSKGYYNENKTENIVPNPEHCRRKIIKNIPKKREKNAHILQYSDEHISPVLEQKQTETIIESNPTINPTIADDDVTDDSKCQNIPKYTSTPCKPKFRIHFKDRSVKTTRKFCRRNIVVAKKKVNKKTAHLIIRQRKNSERNEKFESSLKKPISPLSEEQAKILRQEDIYAVLSHLHGTDDVKA